MAAVFTATIQQWKYCLKKNRCKDIIIECLQTMVRNKQIELNAFVIMSNHVHITWQPLSDYTPAKIHSSFTNFTGKQIKNMLAVYGPALLEEMKSKNFRYMVRRSRGPAISTSTVKTNHLRKFTSGYTLFTNCLLLSGLFECMFG